MGSDNNYPSVLNVMFPFTDCGLLLGHQGRRGLGDGHISELEYTSYLCLSFFVFLASLLIRRKALRIWQGKGAFRDLWGSIIGNNNGAMVAYCHGKHRENDNKGYCTEQNRTGASPSIEFESFARPFYL